MARKTGTTEYAVLGMLALGPGSGYDLKKRIEGSVAHFWSESYGQIYPALRELRTRGWIRRRAGRSGGRRDRHVYEITERGREALASWRAEPPRDAPFRNELLLKLFFGGHDPVGPEIDWIEKLLAEQRDAIRAFEGIREQLNKEQHDHPSLPFWLITLSYGEHRSRALLRWGRETQKTLRALERGAEKRGLK